MFAKEALRLRWSTALNRDHEVLNPCIVAPSAVKLKAGQPLRLRYRVVAFDGTLPQALLNGLVSDWKD